MADNGFQCGAAHAVAPHERLNERVREHLGKCWLDAGLAPRLRFVQRARHVGPSELSCHGSHFLKASRLVRVAPTARRQSRTLTPSPDDRSPNCIDLSPRWPNGKILPIAYYGIVSVLRNEVTVAAERPEILDLTAPAGRRIGWARGVISALDAHDAERACASRRAAAKIALPM
jgi:hypothetical protein